MPLDRLRHAFSAGPDRGPFLMRVDGACDDPLVEFRSLDLPGPIDPVDGTPLGVLSAAIRLSALLRSGALDPALPLDPGGANWEIEAGLRLCRSGLRSCGHALRAAGFAPEAAGRVSRYMLFLAEAPIVGLDPHPASSPCPPDGDAPTDAAAWAEAYGAFATAREAEREAEDDAEMRREAVEDGDLEDADPPDDVFPVSILDDGTIVVLDPDDPGLEMIRHAMRDVFERGFGMTPPAAGDPAP